MTWGRAVPVLAICVVFDLVRFMFEWFIIFGPAIAAAACTAIGSSYVGTTISGVVCASGAAAGGFFGAAFIGPFGLIMAMAVGLAGWGTVTLILAITNPSIWKSNIWNWAWSLFGLGVSEVPFLGAIPMLTITHLRLYAGQIKKDKAALKQYQKEQAQVAAATRSMQQQQQVAEQAQLMQAQAANDARQYTQEMDEAA